MRLTTDTEEPAELLVMNYLIFSNNYINCLNGIV